MSREQDRFAGGALARAEARIGRLEAELVKKDRLIELLRGRMHAAESALGAMPQLPPQARGKRDEALANVRARD